MHNLNGNRFCRCGRSFLSFFFLLSSLPPPFVIFVIRPVRPTGWSATTLRRHNYCNMYLRTYVYVLYFTHLCKQKRKKEKTETSLPCFFLEEPSEPCLVVFSLSRPTL